MITDSVKKIIQQVVHVFETGTPQGRPDAVEVRGDGKNHSMQISYGGSQTTEQGNLKTLLQMYINNGGKFAGSLAPFMARVGVDPLFNDNKFLGILRDAGKEDPIMATTQEQFFDTVYYQPALEFFTSHGCVFPLSLLVIYDSYIHSGRVPSFLRSRFPETMPTSGGDEKSWVIAYVNARHDWLESTPGLTATTYRTRCFKAEIARENWELAKLPIIANGTPVGGGAA